MEALAFVLVFSVFALAVVAIVALSVNHGHDVAKEALRVLLEAWRSFWG